MQMISRFEYEDAIAATRDKRMRWWRDARFGIFVHFGLYSQLGQHEWYQAASDTRKEDYMKLADSFAPKKGAPREWAKLAKEAGAKYMVMTTRHHEGFSLWNSKANPYNSCNYGPHRDIVAEYVDACREFGLKIGFYSSLMDWHHPDAWRCAFDPEARKRFTEYLTALNTELLSNYGKIDILWYDVSAPMESWESWDSLRRNQLMRELQPDIIINDRSKLDEDFGTPEENVCAENRDWEACMTFNGISWGYVDSEQASPYSYSPQQIINMLNTCTSNGGNLLLNFGPAPDGSVPPEAIEPLRKVGIWLKENGEAVYGEHTRQHSGRNIWDLNFGGTSVSVDSAKDNIVYVWQRIWPRSGKIVIGGYFDAPKSVSYLATGEKINFTYEDRRITLHDLPTENPDKNVGIPVIRLEFETVPKYLRHSHYPQVHSGLCFD